MQSIPSSAIESLAKLPASALTARLYDLRKQERALLVEFLGYLAEVDRRRLYLELGFASLFAFLTDHLGFTKGAAFRRTTAARLLARFPAIAPHLADGRLCLTTLVEVRDVLDGDRLTEILDRAAGRTEEQVKELVAALRPRPATPPLLRRLPQPRDPKPPAPPQGELPIGPALPIPAAHMPAPRLQPIAEELHVLRMTVGRELLADLDAARSALSHEIPDGNLEKVVHECIRRTLRAYARRQIGSGDRYIPAAVRDAVWRRDDARCAFVSADGHRCGSTWQVQFHHIHPFAKGGASTVDNVMLACAPHNAYLADLDYGREHMSRFRSSAAGA